VAEVDSFRVLAGTQVDREFAGADGDASGCRAAGGLAGGKLQVAQVKPLLAAGGPLKLGVAEPRRDTASLAATILLGDALATSDDQLPALVKTFRGVVKTSSTAELLRTFGDKVTRDLRPSRRSWPSTRQTRR